METRRPVNGAVGWALLAGYIGLYDTWALTTGRETLSSAFGRTMRHPVKRWPMFIVYGVITLHLFDRLPTWIDPLHQYGRMFGSVAERVVAGQLEPQSIT